MALSLFAAPVLDAVVSVEDLRMHLRLGDNLREDTLLGMLAATATAAAERELRRALLTQTWTLSASAFPCGAVWRLPKPPLQSVTWVRYRDGAGAEQAMDAADYVVDAPTGPNPVHGHVALADGEAWPTPGVTHPSAASVRFACGYGADRESVPAPIRHGVMLLASHLYEHREPVVVGTNTASIPMTVEYLWAPYRALVW